MLFDLTKKAYYDNAISSLHIEKNWTIILNTIGTHNIIYVM